MSSSEGPLLLHTRDLSSHVKQCQPMSSSEGPLLLHTRHLLVHNTKRIKGCTITTNERQVDGPLLQHTPDLLVAL